MALYTQNSTGFLCEFASPPGAGYTAVASQPTDTLTNRVTWWRDRDKGGLSSDWHPSIQGGTEVAKPPGTAGSGVNIMAYRYSSFEEPDGLPSLYLSGVTAARNATGYNGSYRLSLTSTVSNGFAYLTPLSNIYNIKLTQNLRWIVSLYVAPTTSVARSFNVLIKTSGSGTVYTLPFTTGAVANTWTRVYAELDLRSDTSVGAQLGIQIATSGVRLDFDAIMIEELIGDTVLPSAYYAPISYIDGAQIVNGSITGTEIANATITGANIGSGTITGGNIGTATITGANIANSTITGGNIQSATITGSNIASATITGSNISSGTITGSNIAAATISGDRIQSATITSANIASLTITATNIANLTITGGKIASATIDDAKIISMTADKLSAGTIDASIITVTNLNATNIKTGTLSVGLIANASITDAKIASLSASKIDTGTLTSKTIYVNGGAIQSSNYVYNASGWQIDGTGNAQFNTVIVRSEYNMADGSCSASQIFTPGGTVYLNYDPAFGNIVQTDIGGWSYVYSSTGAGLRNIIFSFKLSVSDTTPGGIWFQVVTTEGRSTRSFNVDAKSVANSAYGQLDYTFSYPIYFTPGTTVGVLLRAYTQSLGTGATWNSAPVVTDTAIYVFVPRR